VNAAKLVATGFGLGLAPWAPGTVGSLGAVALGIALHLIGDFPLLLAGLLVVTIAGWVSTEAYMKATGREDPPEVVIDEFAGQLIALLPLSFGLWHIGRAPEVFLAAWPGYVGGFVMFRLFDIWKPWLIGRAERLPGATGVMFDDILAGVAAALVITVAAVIAHGVLI
jgi:phosphatidylglycerophosphatase A